MSTTENWGDKAPLTAETLRNCLAAWYGRLSRIAMSEGLNADDAHEAAQGAIIKALEAIRSGLAFTHPNRRAWLVRVCRSIACDIRRKNNPRTNLDFSELDVADPNLGQEEEGICTRIRAAIASLDEESRFLMTARIEGVPIAEVAAALGIPLNSAYHKSAKARRKLKQALQDFSAE